MSYIEENGYFIFDGAKSSDYGVWIHGGGTYNAPKRRYKDYTVPGRNGTLTIDEGVFEEIEVVYPAFIARDFPANIEAFRNELMSRSGYVRMTDSYHPGEYYLAKYMDGLDADVAPGGAGGSFNLTFRRDPRRFLTSGETVQAFTSSGSITNPTLFASKPLIRVTFDNANTNLVEMPYYNSSPFVSHGITFTSQADGSVLATGTSDGSPWSFFTFRNSTESFKLSEGSYHFECTPSGGSASTYMACVWFTKNGAQIGSTYWEYGSGVDFTINQTEAEYDCMIQAYVYTGTTVENLVFTPLLYADGSQVSMSVGSNRILLENRFEYIDIDCELQDCHCGLNNANKFVTLQNREFPTLGPGITGIEAGAGIESVEITPRWFII